MPYRSYAGIGSRKTPDEILTKFETIAEQMVGKGFTLRSGGADGADAAFERGCDRAEGPKEIFLPWESFEKNPSPLFEQSGMAVKIAERFHPAWKYCSQGSKKLHARNSHQILGKDLRSPVELVICYTNLSKGGTLQALRIAGFCDIPVFNFFEREYTLEEILAVYSQYGK